MIDRTKFERIPDPEILNVVYFTNKTDGIVLTVDSGNNTVLNLSFIPESKYDFLKCTNLSSENRWRKLKPLVSTREVVETTLGTPSARFPFYDQFDDNVGEVHVWYSACSYTIKRGQSELMIPIGRLERLVYFPKKHAPFSEYAAETRDYKRKDSPAVSGRFLYLSKNEKIMFETAFLASGEEVVMSIELSAPDLPPEAKCKELPKRSP